MTDEQIIKSLECCATDDGDDCFQCPYGNIVYKPGNGGCVNRCRKEALVLINRQKAEIERLKDKIFVLENDLEKAESLSDALENDVEIKLNHIYDLEEKLKKSQIRSNKRVCGTVEKNQMNSITALEQSEALAG